MGNGNLVHSIKRLSAGRNVVHRVKYFGAAVPHAARIADAYRYSFKNDKSLLMLKGFLIDLLGPDRPFAMFAHLPVELLLSGLW